MPPSHSYFILPGHDWSSWSGVVMGAPGNVLWGFRVGWLENGKIIIDQNLESRVKRTGPFAAGGVFARLFTDVFTLTWAAGGDRRVVGRIEVLADADLVVEAYPAHDFPSRNDKGVLRSVGENVTPYLNPAVFSLRGGGMIRGTSSHVRVETGKSFITDAIGTLKVTGRSVEILPEANGLEHFLLHLLPGSEAGGTAWLPLPDSVPAANERAVSLGRPVKKGETIFLVAETSPEALSACGIATATEAMTLVQRVEADWQSRRFHGTGELGGMAEPMASELSWLSCWNPFERKRWTPPGRYHWQGDGKYYVWGWDEHFSVVLADLMDAGLAHGNMDMTNLNWWTGAYAAWSVYCRRKDVERLRRDYERIRAIRPPGDHDLIVGCGGGMDDTPMREEWRKLGKIYGVDAATYQAMYAELMSNAARVLDLASDAEAYEADRQALVQVIDEMFWYEPESIYRNRYVSGEWPVTESPTSFYPWLAGAVPPERSTRLLQSLLDERKFWGKWVLPSLARSDPQYGKPSTTLFGNKMYMGPYGYWRGAIWPPPNFFVYEGLKRAGHDREAALLAAKSVALWRKNFEEKGFAPENFNPETGEISDWIVTLDGEPHPMALNHQSWSMLLPFLGIKELIDMEIWTDPDALRFGSLSPTVSSVENYPWHGHAWKVVSGGGSLTLHRDGQRLFEAAGGPCTVRMFKCSEEIADNPSCSFELAAEAEIRITLFADESNARQEFVVPTGRAKICVENGNRKSNLLSTKDS